jgi:ABC-2 type transport system permease protein
MRREYWEHWNLFVGTPAVLTLVIVVAVLWAANQPDADQLKAALEQLGVITDGMSGFSLAPLLMPAAIPYLIGLSFSVIGYLNSTLYQDRKDLSILFWQSMPVSDLKTVLSKVATVVLLAPAMLVVAMSAMFIIFGGVIAIMGLLLGVDTIGPGQMLVAALYSLLLVYLSCVLGALWLLPTIGWLLLFSAFARSLPFLWAVGTFILLIFLEDFVFGSQFLANWVESRTGIYQYIVFRLEDFPGRLFDYDMLLGILLGSILITGAVLMRRFTD